MGKTFKDSGRHGVSHARKYRHMPEFFVKKPRTIKCVTGKIGFPTDTDARTRADEILYSGKSRGATSFRVYPCNLCNHYHFTSQA